MPKTPPPRLRIHIRKEALKFSAAHMTIFPDGSKEALHGHNYQVSVEIVFKEADELPFIAFSEIKAAVRQVCENWDEKVLLAERTPHFKLLKSDDVQTEFELCKNFYSLPTDEIVRLPVDNITSEALALVMGHKVFGDLHASLKKSSVKKFILKVEESPGQGASLSFTV